MGEIPQTIEKDFVAPQPLNKNEVVGELIGEEAQDSLKQIWNPKMPKDTPDLADRKEALDLAIQDVLTNNENILKWNRDPDNKNNQITAKDIYALIFSEEEKAKPETKNIDDIQVSIEAINKMPDIKAIEKGIIQWRTAPQVCLYFLHKANIASESNRKISSSKPEIFTNVQALATAYTNLVKEGQSLPADAQKAILKAFLKDHKANPEPVELEKKQQFTPEVQKQIDELTANIMRDKDTIFREQNLRYLATPENCETLAQSMIIKGFDKNSRINISYKKATFRTFIRISIDGQDVKEYDAKTLEGAFIKACEKIGQSSLDQNQTEKMRELKKVLDKTSPSPLPKELNSEVNKLRLARILIEKNYDGTVIPKIKIKTEIYKQQYNPNDHYIIKTQIAGSNEIATQPMKDIDKAFTEMLKAIPPKNKE